jgi:dipeptidyl aminopeptidase/acylaminoacyl peptidase
MGKWYIGIWVLFSGVLWAQQPALKVLDHEDLVNWKSIQRTVLSQDGNHIAYVVSAEKGDPELRLYDTQSGSTSIFPRSKRPEFSEDGQFLLFYTSPSEDSLRHLKIKKTKKEDLPGDTLKIYSIRRGTTKSIPHVQSHQFPSKWSGWIVYHLDDKRKDSSPPKDTTKQENQSESQTKKVKPKKESKENGSPLIIASLKDTFLLEIPFVTRYEIADKAETISWFTTGKDSTWLAGLYKMDCRSRTYQCVQSHDFACKQIVLSSDGSSLVAILQADSLKEDKAKHFVWSQFASQSTGRVLLDSIPSTMGNQWTIAADQKPIISGDDQRLYVSIRPVAPPKDTTLLDEDIAKVEVWHWEDYMLHTQQSVQVNREKNRSYQWVYLIDKDTFISLNDPEMREVTHSYERKGKYTLIYDERQYYKSTSWDGGPAGRDVQLIDLQNGERWVVGNNIKGNIQFSTDGNYLFWYSKTDSLWMLYSIETRQAFAIQQPEGITFYDEIFDMPDHPGPYGQLGWAEKDQFFYIYDRYDIWRIDPKPYGASPFNLTNGRSQKTVYRYLSLDDDNPYINEKEDWLLHTFQEDTRYSTYTIREKSGKQSKVFPLAGYYYGKNVQKSKKANHYLFTKENFEEFPDLWHAFGQLSKAKKISRVNPQQSQYAWGSAELFKWTSLDGIPLEGLLYKPAGFRSDRQYPMIVTFYEKSSDGLHRYRAPSPGRSTINYAFYTSRGYVVFVPDIPYKDGYPGESAFNAVIPGTTSLIDKGFIDKMRIGVQGHSWGGYQIAYLLTRTNIFRCAESGAPVVNMISAYGGIRWETGLSRMFQYEKTQSRIGGTLWDYPLRYLENSPIFTMDKVETPVLIMHNDKDGHVPWYQGIEYFTALRRLNKPAWLLNYNEEPHWPLKLANRIDFNIRMQQFFDHYLKGEPMPLWMANGVPAIDKGINQGYEAVGSDEKQN